MTAANRERPLPVILGEAPSRSGDQFWQFPLSGAVGERLCTLAGIEPEKGGSRYGRFWWPLRDYYELRNLLERYPGPLGKGADLPSGLAVPARDVLRPELAGRVVVLLGRRLARLFGAPDEFFTWALKQDGTWLAAIPHPSGLNHAYDDPEVRRAAGRTLTEAMALAASKVTARDETLIANEAPAVWRRP